MDGAVLAKNGEKDKALACFEQAIQAAPNHLPARLARCELWMADERLDRAEEELSWILKVDPASYPARFLRGKVRSSAGRHAEAVLDYTETLLHAPDDEERAKVLML